jgi:hypothetical protein
MIEISGVFYTRRMGLDYLYGCQDALRKVNSKQAADMDFALAYFADATKHLIDAERPFDEEREKKEADWDKKFAEMAAPLIESSGLGVNGTNKSLEIKREPI